MYLILRIITKTNRLYQNQNAFRASIRPSLLIYTHVLNWLCGNIMVEGVDYSISTHSFLTNTIYTKGETNKLEIISVKVYIMYGGLKRLMYAVYSTIQKRIKWWDLAIQILTMNGTDQGRKNLKNIISIPVHLKIWFLSCCTSTHSHNKLI